ncbi:MAG TPA: TRAP transporter substrate-binding protein [Desulfosporosinus sp.]|nr:TRAP transporter substrate-binding protein [Desulfosporosinus sp.]
MTRRYIILTGIVLIATSILFTGCGNKTAGTSETDAKGEVITLKLAHHASAKTPFALGGQKFADLVSERTGGAVKIEIYTDSTLGGSSELVDALKIGTVDMTLTPASQLDKMYSAMDLFYLPFLFSDRDQVYKVADGDIGKSLFSELEAKSGLKTLGFFDSGFRTITNNVREIKSPKDLKGLKMRVPLTPLLSDAFQAMGSIITPMDMSELFTALQQGTVNGQDNPIGNVYSGSYYEVQPYITLSNHSYAAILLLVSDQGWKKIPDKYKSVIEKSAQEAAVWERKLAIDADVEYLGKMKAFGVKVTELTPEQRKEFQDAVKPVREKYAKNIGEDLINKVLNIK